MDEVFDMLLPVFEEEQQSKGLPTPQPVVESDYTVGENVRVKSARSRYGCYYLRDQAGVAAGCNPDLGLRARYPGDPGIQPDRKDLIFHFSP